MNRGIQGQYAGVVTRGIAFVIDLMVIIVAVAFTTWLVTRAFGLVRIDVDNCGALTKYGMYLDLVCNTVRVGLLVFALLFAPVYALFFWTSGGQTPGKAVMGIRVIRTDGKGLTFPNALRRLVGFVLCFLTLGLGFALMITDNQRQGLDDTIGGTYVIYAWQGVQNVETIQNVKTWVAKRRRKKGGEPTAPPS